MNTSTSTIEFKRFIPAALLDVLGLLLIYFIPTLSHLAGIPFYLFEPMRIIVILSLLHSRNWNSYTLAIALPIFSFLISSHPVLMKAGLISFELVLNVFLYYFLKKRLHTHWAIIGSVIASKFVYYGIKYILIQGALLESNLISTPIYFQLFTTTIFGLYAFLWFKKENKNKFKNNNKAKS